MTTVNTKSGRIIKVVSREEEKSTLTESDTEMDERAVEAVKAAINKARIEISYIPRDLITVIFYYQISLNPLKTQSLSQVSFPLLFPLRYIVPPVFTNSDKGKNKGKKII